MSQYHTLQTTVSAEVERTLHDHLAAFAGGDFDAWGAGFAPNVFFTAADPQEVFFGREAAVAEMYRDFDLAFEDGLELEVQPRSTYVHYSSDRKVAWSAASLRYVVKYQRATSSFLLRHTNVLSFSNRRWSILATHYSLALPVAKVLQALKTGRLPAPYRVGDAIGAGSLALTSALRQHLADLANAPVGREAQVFGPFPGEHAEGEVAVRALFSNWGSSLGALRLRTDGVRAGLVSDDVGWVGANVEASVLSDNQRVALPLRALVVYRQEYGSPAIDHLHLSVGIPDELME